MHINYYIFIYTLFRHHLPYPKEPGSGSINSLAYTSDERYILAAHSGRTVKVFEVLSGRVRHTMTSHSDQVLALAVDQGNDKVAFSCGKDRKVGYETKIYGFLYACLCACLWYSGRHLLLGVYFETKLASTSLILSFYKLICVARMGYMLPNKSYTLASSIQCLCIQHNGMHIGSSPLHFVLEYCILLKW